MIILTAVVALTTVFQAAQSYSNNSSTSRQVDRVIGVASDIDKAADHISTAADHIGDAGTASLVAPRRLVAAFPML